MSFTPSLRGRGKHEIEIIRARLKVSRGHHRANYGDER